MDSFHLFLISSASTRSLLYLSFIVPIFGQNAPLMFPIFLNRSLVFPPLSFSSHMKHLIEEGLLISSSYSLKLFSWIPSLPCFLLLFTLPLFIKPPHITTLPSCFSFPLVWFCSPPPVQVLQASVHSSSGTLLSRSSPLNLFITSTMNSYRIWFKSYLASLVFFPDLFSLSLNSAIRSWWSGPQSGPGLVFAEYIQLLHLQLQRI